jgi:hypothetical protein
MAALKQVPRERVESVIDEFYEQTAKGARCRRQRIHQGHADQGARRRPRRPPDQPHHVRATTPPASKPEVDGRGHRRRPDQATSTRRSSPPSWCTSNSTRPATSSSTSPTACATTCCCASPRWTACSRPRCGTQRSADAHAVRLAPTSRRPPWAACATPPKSSTSSAQRNETAIIDNVREYDPDLAQKILDEMFVFENLLDIDDRGIQLLLREVQSDSLIIALKGASPELREKIFKNMSQRAAEMLREDLESRGPVRLSEVEANRRKSSRSRAAWPKKARSSSAAAATTPSSEAVGAYQRWDLPSFDTPSQAAARPEPRRSGGRRLSPIPPPPRRPEEPPSKPEAGRPRARIHLPTAETSSASTRKPARMATPPATRKARRAVAWKPCSLHGLVESLENSSPASTRRSPTRCWPGHRSGPPDGAPDPRVRRTPSQSST